MMMHGPANFKQHPNSVGLFISFPTPYFSTLVLVFST